MIPVVDRKKIGPLRTNKEAFFAEYLWVLKPVIESYLTQQKKLGPKRASDNIKEAPIVLSNRDISVLAQILYYSYRFRDLDEEERIHVLSSPHTRRKMSSRLGMSENHFRNCIQHLRETGAIVDTQLDKHNRVRDIIPNKMLTVSPDKQFHIIITFDIVD